MKLDANNDSDRYRHHFDKTNIKVKESFVFGALLNP
jgi:hypothetical protein